MLEAGHGFSLMGIGTLCAAAWRRARRGRPEGSGRVVVRGRNFECNIKNKKGPRDIAIQKMTAKHLSKIVRATREAGGIDPEQNSTLKRLIKMAIKDNVKRSAIDNRLKKLVEDKENLQDIVYSATVHGAGVIVECTTDNNLRTRPAVRKCFTDIGFEISSGSSCDHMFNRRGVITYKDVDEESVMEAAMEADVEDTEAMEDGSVQVLTLPENFHSTLDVMEKQDLEAASSDVTYLPTMEVELNDDQTYHLKHIMHLLDNQDDVEEVYTNAIMTDKELEFDSYGNPKKLKAKA